ncbi:MAG: translocation/assembly module TamB domain-containing protein [Desulfuromonadales bacterium]|nr:translocation/assembly module TamB domain-containing protein [Desulfuromonadales bacterium]
MVTTVLKYAALLFLLLALLLFGAGAWLVGSDSGSRALLAGVNRWTPLTIEVETLSGRLMDELRLDGVRLRWPGGEAATPVLRLRWQPRQLLHTELTIDELTLGEMVIHLTPESDGGVKEEKKPLQWPSVTGLPRRLHASIASLHVAGVVIHLPEAEAQHFGPLSSRLDWRDGILRLSALQARTPYGSFSGEVSAGMVTPSLALRLHGEGFDAATGLKQANLTLDLTAGTVGEFLTGPLVLDLDTTPQGNVRLNADLGLASAGVELRDLLLSRSVAAGEVRGRIRYRFDDSVSPLLLQLQLLGVDLSPETTIPTDLSGALDLAGSPDAYSGQFDLNNRGADWRNLRLAGNLAGNRQQLALSKLAGQLLAGQIAGALDLDWSGPFRLTAALQGSGLDPGTLSSPVAGELNFDLNSTLLLPTDAPLQLELTARLHDSILNGHPLTGAVSARLDAGDVLLRHLELHGNGIDLTAAGRLQEQVDFFVALQHLEELLPDATGAGQASGWLRWQGGELTGAINSEGRALAYAGVSIARGTLQVERPTVNHPISLHAAFNNIDYQNRHFTRLELQADGQPEEHQLAAALNWPQGEVQVDAAGGYEAGSWSGRILQLAGKDQEQGAWRLAAPVTLLLTKESVRFSPLELTSEHGERIEVAATYERNQGAGEVIAQWHDLQLARANPWLAELQLAGASSGSVTGRWQESGAMFLQGKVVAAGKLKQGDLNLTVERLASDFSWDEKGLEVVCDLNLATQSHVSARLTSPEPGQLALPQRLSLQLDWDGFGPELIARWLPPTLTLRGSLSGALTAELYPGQSFEVVGATSGNNIVLSWKQKRGEVNMALRNADVTWRWQQKSLDLDLALTLVDHGEIAGKLSLPLPATLPVAMIPAGPLRGEVKGRFRERGLLTTLLPGLMRESHGDLDLDLRIAGSWQEPLLAGTLQLSGAGAYLPQAGITLRDLSIKADFVDDKVRFPAVKVASGDGQLTGEGELRLQNWKIAEYSGKLGGERFLTLNLPELRIITSPALTFSGTAQTAKVRGEIKLPELLVRGRQTKAPLGQHADVVIVDAPLSDERERPLDLDLEVRLLLGDRVMVDFGGIDARLGGDVIVTARGYETINGRGKINVVQGAYAAYGMKLDINRGSLLFAGGPIDQPTLDILALRRSGEVQAGVRVGGTPRAPTVTLYSEPSMPDTDILSYIVLGRPMGSDAGQADLLMVAAGALLAKGESTVLQDRLRRRVGLDVIDIQSGDGDLTTSVITVGKYLNPKLYISLGHSLFTGSNVVGLRYDISERWQAESKVGEESGVDLFYKIEFQ